MKASISAGLRRTSFVRSAPVRSGLATMSAMRCEGAGCGSLAQPARKTRRKKKSLIAALEQECAGAPACSKNPKRIDLERQVSGRARCRDGPQAPIRSRRRAEDETARKDKTNDERRDGALDRKAPGRILESLPKIGD